MRADAAFVTRNLTVESTTTISGATTLFKFISLGLIIAIGSAGNALVIYAFGRYLRLRQPPYSLMLGFVTLDLTRVFVCFPISFITVVHRLRWRYGGQLCQMMAFTNVFCLLGNCLSVFGMAVDRYVDNKHRGIYRRHFRYLFGTVMLLVVWGMAFLFAFPTVYGVRQQMGDVVEPQCTFPHHYYPNDVDTLGLMVSLTTVMVLTNVLYLKLYFFLRRRRRMRPVAFEPAISETWGFYEHRGGLSVRQRWEAESPSDAPIAIIGRTIHHPHMPRSNAEVAQRRTERQRDDEKLTKLCFSINVIFTLMWLPYIVVCFWFAAEFEKAKASVPDWLEVSATWLTYLQVTITPLAFFSLSSFTRRQFRNINEKHRFSPTLSDSSY